MGKGNEGQRGKAVRWKRQRGRGGRRIRERRQRGSREGECRGGGKGRKGNEEEEA